MYQQMNQKNKHLSGEYLIAEWFVDTFLGDTMIKELTDGTAWKKATYYEDGDLKGEWLITIKIDGVRAIRNKNGEVVSRNSKPLYHLDNFQFNDAEIYYKDWDHSVSLVRTQGETEVKITQDMIYNLDPIDERLVLGTYSDPTEEQILSLMNQVINQGYEGLVMRQDNKWLKVVPVKYADIRITDITEGKGKCKGTCGSIITNYGKVGSFEKQPNKSDFEFRQKLLRNKDFYIGKIIQVGFREKTKDGKLRFPKFIRLRLDKDYEDL